MDEELPNPPLLQLKVEVNPILPQPLHRRHRTAPYNTPAQIISQISLQTVLHYQVQVHILDETVHVFCYIAVLDFAHDAALFFCFTELLAVLERDLFYDIGVVVCCSLDSVDDSLTTLRDLLLDYVLANLFLILHFLAVEVGRPVRIIAG